MVITIPCFKNPVVNHNLLHYFITQNAYGYDFFCKRLRIQSCTVMNFFLYGCGDSHNRTKIFFCTVTEKLVTVCNQKIIIPATFKSNLFLQSKEEKPNGYNGFICSPQTPTSSGREI